MEIKKLKNILEAVLLAAERSLTVIQLEALFELDEDRPSRDEIRKALHEMADDFATRGFELKQVASGFRLQVKQEYATWVGRLWEEKPARYTRALLETMALIAYRQPITRGEIEEVRGVSVSSNIIKTLLERDWIKVLGHKDVPGKPTLYGTTKAFLDYFNLQKLDQLPTLAEIKDLDSIHPELQLDEDAVEGSENSQTGSDLNDTGLNDTGLNDTGLNDTDLNDTDLNDGGQQPSEDDNEEQSSTDADEILQSGADITEEEPAEADEHVTAEADEDAEQVSDEDEAESTRPAFNV